MAIAHEVYHGDAIIALGNPKIFLANVQDLDTISQEFVVEIVAGRSSQLGSVGAVFPGQSKFFVTSIETQAESSVLQKSRLEGVGISGGQKSWRSITAFGREVALGPTEKTPGKGDFVSYAVGGGLGTRWNITEPLLGVRDSYYTFELPPSNQIGTGLVPPNAPEPPPFIWGNADPIRLQHPVGWSLESRDVEEIVVGRLWRVTDAYSYRQPGLPD